MTQSCIIMPMYNDWPSAAKLVGAIDRVVAHWGRNVTVLVINDGSRETLDDPERLTDGCRHLHGLSIVNLVCNQGHQRAIAVGLAYAHSLDCFEAVFVMDSDGEDPPEELALLQQAGLRHPDAVITADRVSRSEGAIFRLCYLCYKGLFRALTGVNIRFGNFCRIPASLLGPLIHRPELWNSISGCIKKSGLPRRSIDSHRGQRYFGPSKMSFVSLVLHGLSAISVFKETLLLRLLIVSVPATALAAGAAVLFGTGFGAGDGAAAVGLIFSVGICLLLAVTDAVGFLLLIQALEGRARRRPGPALFWRDYVDSVIPVIQKPV